MTAAKRLLATFMFPAVLVSSLYTSWTRPLVAQGSKPLLERIISQTSPLKYDRGDRLPFYAWSAVMSGIDDDVEIERLLRALADRGIGVFSHWRAGDPESPAYAARVGKIQQRLGLRVNVDATGAVYSFCDGSPATAHVDADGAKFFDDSFGGAKMGCPFALKDRYAAMRARLEPFLKRYVEEGVRLDLWSADWEIDGPIEWNDGWKNSKRCQRCREQIENIESFTEFQMALRRERSDMQRRVFVEPIQSYFPDALISNYGAYPHNGYRYWYDYFEKPVSPGAGVPGIVDQNSFYRQWAHEFEPSGYTFAMPVVYTWYQIFAAYDFSDTDYRWFYNLLLVGSNAARHTPQKTPIIPFVHWTPTAPPPDGLPAHLVPMSDGAYRELLWHLLLRGHDTFCMWCPTSELETEIKPPHEVYAAALEYREFLDHGTPLIFDVPSTPQPVVSALRLADRVLVRRTDFGAAPERLEIKIDGQTLSIPRTYNRCQILTFTSK